MLGLGLWSATRNWLGLDDTRDMKRDLTEARADLTNARAEVAVLRALVAALVEDNPRVKKPMRNTLMVTSLVPHSDPLHGRVREAQTRWADTMW